MKSLPPYLKLVFSCLFLILYSLFFIHYYSKPASANEPNPLFFLEKTIESEKEDFPCFLVCPGGNPSCREEEKVEICEPPGEIRLDGKLSLPEKINMPVLREVAEYLEGPYYNEEKLQELLKMDTGIPELHGPLDKLLPLGVQDEFRNKFIQRVKSGEFGQSYDYQIPVYKDSKEAGLEVCEKPWREPPQKEDELCRISLKKVAESYKENLPGDLWLKVPMNARGNVTINGYFNFYDLTNCQAFHGEITQCDLIPKKSVEDLKSVRSAAETGKYHYRLEVPQLVRLREVAKILWERLTGSQLQEKYTPDFLFETTGLREDPKDDVIRTYGQKPQLTIVGSFPRPQSGAYLAGTVKSAYFLPYLADSYHFLSGESGLLTNFKPELLTKFGEKKFLPEDVIIFEKSAPWWEELWKRFWDLIGNFPMVASIWSAQNFVQEILTPSEF